MSFGGQSGGPWQRNNMMQAYSDGPGPQQMYMQQQQQQNNMGGFGQMQGLVSYPQQQRSNSLNAMAFQQNVDGNNVGGGDVMGDHGQQHQHGLGTVTKINNECGLINNEIFFYRNVCKGPSPKLADRVIFESTLSNFGQFKWNAHMVQTVPSHGSHAPQPLMGSTNMIKGRSSGGFGGMSMSSHDYRGGHSSRHDSPRRASPIRDRHLRLERERRERERNTRPLDRDDDEIERKRRREDRSRDRGNSSRFGRERERIDSKHSSVERKERERERDRERDKGVSERSPVRTVAKGRSRFIKRYMVQIPKTLLLSGNSNFNELQNRYTNLYIPSDFFNANILWPKIFTPDNAFSLRRSCQFHIMHKMVEAPYEEDSNLLQPADADYIYSAKVMLLACPPLAEIYAKCIESADAEMEAPAMHPTRLIRFLVGTRGHNEPMAIGGPWSPSLDGKNPDKDPSVLIRTAIRTCKALTGIDLSNCTQWYRFVELHYLRNDYKHKDKNAGPRVETVVMYMPDVHSCMLSADDYQKLSDVYKAQGKTVIARKNAAAKSQAAVTATTTTAAAGAVNSSEAAEEPTVEDSNNKNAEQQKGNDKSNSAVDAPVAVAVKSESDENADVAKDGADEPTHYSKLDIKTIKLEQLRKELLARQLASKGPRSSLLGRLAKALEDEKAAEEKANEQTATADVEVIDDESSSKMETDLDIESETQKDAADTNGKGAAEDLDAWANVVDVDMNDIVVLDEYDSRKNPEEAPKEMSESEKNRLIRQYTLPNTPHIVVHPSKTAKGGKFDCAVMSLSVLLDYYNGGYTKERHFEVAFFAELFNEMLVRDFGFNIFKELYLWKDNSKSKVKNEDTTVVKKEETENNVAEDAKATKDKDGKAKSNVEQNNDKSSSDKDGDAGKDDAKNATAAEQSKNKSASANSKDEKDKAKDVVDKKMVVVKPQLLLSFVYFDATNCGYIFEKDLEDLFAILGLNLSRGQIHKLLGKFESRQSFYYRKLTDKEEILGAEPIIEDAVDLSAEELKKIIGGNMMLIKSEDKSLQEAKASENSDLINYNGAIVHVGKLMEHIKRTELEYSNLDKLYTDVRKQHSDLQREHTRANNKLKDLQSEVKSLTRKLADTDGSLFALNRKYKDQQSTITFIYNRVAPYFKEKDKSKDKDAEKDKDKDKTESIRDKDKKDEKEKQKDDKEKHKEDKEKQKDDKEKQKDDKEKQKDDKEKQKDDKTKDKNVVKDNKEQSKNEKQDNSNDDKQKEPEQSKSNAKETVQVAAVVAKDKIEETKPAAVAVKRSAPVKTANATTPTKAAKKAMPANKAATTPKLNPSAVAKK